MTDAFNQLKSTNVCGHLYVSNMPDGSQPAAFSCAGPSTLATLNPFTPIQITGSVIFMPGVLSCYHLVLCKPGSTNYNVTLPLAISGMVFYLHNTNNHTTTMLTQSSQLIYYENPVGTYASATSYALTANSKYIFYSDGLSWSIFYESAIFAGANATLAAQVAASKVITDQITYNSGTSTLTTNNFRSNGNVRVDGGLAVIGASTLTGPVTATGNISLGGSIFAGTNSTVGGTHSVTGVSTLGGVVNTGNSTVAGNETVSGTLIVAGNVSANSRTVTAAQVGYLSNVTSDLQAQINAVYTNNPVPYSYTSIAQVAFLKVGRLNAANGLSMVKFNIFSAYTLTSVSTLVQDWQVYFAMPLDQNSGHITALYSRTGDVTSSGNQVQIIAYHIVDANHTDIWLRLEPYTAIQVLVQPTPYGSFTVDMQTVNNSAFPSVSYSFTDIEGASIMTVQNVVTPSYNLNTLGSNVATALALLPCAYGVVYWTGSAYAFANTYNVDTANSLLGKNTSNGFNAGLHWVRLLDASNFKGIIMATVNGSPISVEYKAHTVTTVANVTYGPNFYNTAYDLHFACYDGGSNPGLATTGFYFIAY